MACFGGFMPGKGFRDIDGAREADDWSRGSGPRKGKGALDVA